MAKNKSRMKPSSITPVQRAVKSKQPRFETKDASLVRGIPGVDFQSILRWYHDEIDLEPPYIATSRKRDEWLSQVWRKEPHLSGVVNSVVSIDANRGWELEGGRNQVNRYTVMLHSWNGAPGMSGYRTGLSSASQSFYYTDLGGVVELGRDGDGGPARSFYHTDSTRCQLTGDPEAPLYYDPLNPTASAGAGFWYPGDFMRIVSLPDIHENMKGLGFCPVSRCIELTKLMVSIYEYHKEKLGSKAPKGLLLLKNVSETQWENALTVREARNNEKQLDYFDAVAVLASMGGMEPDAKLVALASLPDNFEIQAWTSMLIYGYALCFGYDPSEFYPVQFGALGRGTEMEVQHEKASAKGNRNFILALQEQLQRQDILPASLAFQFVERDEQAEVEQATSAKAWADVYKTIRETGISADAEGGITREELRMLLAEKNILPKEWTEVPDDIEATDEEMLEDELPEASDTDSPMFEITLRTRSRQKRILRDRLLSKPHILRAIDLFPHEDIVCYQWPKNAVLTLWQDASTLTHRMIYPVARAKAKLLPPSIVKPDDIALAIAEAEIINTDLASMLTATEVSNVAVG